MKFTFSPCCRAIKSLNHPSTGNIRCDKFHQNWIKKINILPIHARWTRAYLNSNPLNWCIVHGDRHLPWLKHIWFLCYLIHTLSDPYVIWSICYLIHMLSDPYTIWSICYRIHTLSDPYAIRSIRYPIHLLSDPYAIWSIRYLIHTLSNPYPIQSIGYLIHTLSIPYAIWSIRYLIHTLSDPFVVNKAEVPINLSRKTIKEKFCEAKLF